MNITLYNNLSDHRCLNKELETIETISGATPYGECSVQAPVMRLRPFENWAIVNYAYIGDYQRYYYVTEIKILSGNVLELHCQSDPLMSFRNAIKNCQGVLVANENLTTPYIRDLNYPVSLKKTITTYLFDADPFNIENTGYQTGHNYVLTTAGGGEYDPYAPDQPGNDDENESEGEG